jgi:D-beta-D-heptose 7-phosphate kinase/D-beta-D-heptose 1-phosphate adenosyltransferase
MNKILVIGDSCVDSYTYCKVKRLAPDKPVPVLEVQKVENTPGMAYNTFRNVKSLTESCDLLTNANWDQIVKNRYVDTKSNHMFVRVDHMQDVNRISYDDSIFKYETIIISDYDKGFLSKEDIYYICDHHKQVFLDTKKDLGDWATKAKFIKINEDEYERSKDYINEKLRDQVIRTLGSEGCTYLNSKYPVKEKVEVIDVSGAGDAFMAALAFKFTETRNISESLYFANDCASQVVRHKGMTVI